MEALKSHKEYLAKWYVKNLDKNREKRRLWHILNPVRSLELNLRWQKDNPEKMRAIWRRSKRNHRDIAILQESKRRALKLSAEIGDLKAIAKIYQRCRELKTWFDVVVDHVIPLSRGGKHASENLQIIYAFENATKHARLDYEPKVIFT